MRSVSIAFAVALPFLSARFLYGEEDWSFRAEGSQWTSYLPDQSELSRARFEGTLSLRGKLSDEWTLVAAGRGFIDPTLLTSDRLPQDVQREEGRGAELRSGYLEYRPLPWTLKLGLQEVVWGEALHFFSADLLHPKDFRDLVLNSLSWSRRPQFGFSAGYENERMSLSLVYFPVSRLNRYPRFGSDFFLPEFSVESLGLPRPQDEGLWHFDEPVIGANLGLRFEELQVNFLSAMIRDPQGYYNDQLIHHDRIFVGGITGSYASEDWIARMEWILTPRRILAFPKKSTELNHLSSFEYSGIENQNLSVNLHWNERWNCDESELLKCRLIQFGPKWIWLNMPGDLELENSIWIEFKDKSFWWSLRLRRPLTENLKAELLIDEFVGEGDGAYSKLSRRDQYGFRIEWAF